MIRRICGMCIIIYKWVNYYLLLLKNKYYIDGLLTAGIVYKPSEKNLRNVIKMSTNCGSEYLCTHYDNDFFHPIKFQLFQEFLRHPLSSSRYLRHLYIWIVWNLDYNIVFKRVFFQLLYKLYTHLNFIFFMGVKNILLTAFSS